MNKKIIIALIASIVIFVIIILGINIWLKKYAAESTVVTPQAQIPAQIGEQRVITGMPVEEKEESEPEPQEEEPEREAPIGSKEPLLN